MGWETGGRFKREGKYVYLRLIHADGRNQHNIVKQLSSSKKKIKKKKRITSGDLAEKTKRLKKLEIWVLTRMN